MSRLSWGAAGLSVRYLHVLVIWVGVRLLRGTVGLRMGVGSMRGLVSLSGQSALSTPKMDLALMKPTPIIGLNPTTRAEAEMMEAMKPLLSPLSPPGMTLPEVQMSEEWERMNEDKSQRALFNYRQGSSSDTIPPTWLGNPFLGEIGFGGPSADTDNKQWTST